MNFLDRMLLRKEVDATMKAIKTHWPAIFHVLALVLLWLGPSVTAYLHGLPASAQWGGTAVVLWAELMRWLQSPNQTG